MKLNNFLKKCDETFKYDLKEDFDLQEWKEKTLDKLSIVLDSEGNNQFTEGFEIQKKEKEKQELLDTGKIFFIEGKYFVNGNTFKLSDFLHPAMELSLQELSDGHFKAFNKMEELGDIVILSNTNSNFVILNNDDKIVYESLSGEVIRLNRIEDGFIFTDHLNQYFKTVEKQCGLNYTLNIKTGYKDFDEYNDKYELKGGKINNFIPGKLKEKFGKLILPNFIDIEEFLDTPFFGDIIAIAMQESEYKGKTFLDCSRYDNFKHIYNAGGNIFNAKSNLILEKSNFKIYDKNIDEKLLKEISEVVVGKMK